MLHNIYCSKTCSNHKDYFLYCQVSVLWNYKDLLYRAKKKKKKKGGKWSGDKITYQKYAKKSKEKVPSPFGYECGCVYLLHSNLATNSKNGKKALPSNPSTAFIHQRKGKEVPIFRVHRMPLYNRRQILYTSRPV